MHPEISTDQIRLDGDDLAPSETVVQTVADAEGVPSLDLWPLATSIDPDALDDLVESMARQPEGTTARVTFSYSGYRVTVTGHGTVSLDELDRD